MKRAWMIGIALAFVIFIVDFITKSWVYHHLPLISYNAWHYPYGGIPVFKDFFGIEFAVVHAENRGAAWGTLSSMQVPLLMLRCVLIIALLIYLYFVNHLARRVVPFLMVIAGALGNVVDYFIYGQVVDMLKFVIFGFPFAIFNVADSAITLGILWLLIDSYVWKKQLDSVV